jgi:hypothetical protein
VEWIIIFTERDALWLFRLIPQKANIHKISISKNTLKDWSAFDAAGNDMVQGSGGVYAGFSWHDGTVT